MIKAILIDDEIHCLEALSMLIAEHCPQIEVIDQCASAKKALLSIEKTMPDIIFLDIEMPIMNGFEMLEHFQETPFAVIFTTSYDQYAIRAIRFSALDYLLKPINPKELVSAVKKIAAQKSNFTKEQLEMLIDQVKNKPSGFLKIALPTSQGFELILADQILKCEANDNYTHIHCKNNVRITACRTLKEIEEQLNGFEFFIRVHHSYLVNLNEIHRYVRGEGGYLIMSDASIVDVSRSRKELLLKKLQPNRF